MEQELIDKITIILLMAIAVAVAIGIVIARYGVRGGTPPQTTGSQQGATSYWRFPLRRIAMVVLVTALMVAIVGGVIVLLYVWIDDPLSWFGPHVSEGASEVPAFKLDEWIKDLTEVIFKNFFQLLPLVGLILIVIAALAFISGRGAYAFLTVAVMAFLIFGSKLTYDYIASDTEIAAADEIECPVRTCIFANSTTWSQKVPTGAGLSWLRSDTPDTVLEIRANGDDKRIKEWANGDDVAFKRSTYVQVRLKEGTGAMVYFDSPSEIAAFEKAR